MSRGARSIIAAWERGRLRYDRVAAPKKDPHLTARAPEG
jgi:hypothetical protein